MVSIELELRTHELVQRLRWGAFFSNKLAPHVCIYALNQYTAVWQALENPLATKEICMAFTFCKNTHKRRQAETS